MLTCRYSLKAVKLYTDLRKVNHIMTLEALASPSTTQKILSEAGKQWAHREMVLKNGTLKINWGKQGKHIIGDKNYITNSNKSIWGCSVEKTQSLIDTYAGTGRRARNSLVEIPGKAGYQEVVNFDKETGKSLATTWGKIHYAKNGIHIVPYLPK